MFNNKYYLETMFDDLFNNKELMKTDIYEEGENYIFEIDLPGVKQNEISVEIVNEYLNVDVVSDSSNSDDNKNYIKRERVVRNMKRQFYVGNINDNEVNASFKDGILRISIPKEEKKKRQIEINLD